MTSWYETFFSGLSVEFWIHAAPPPSSEELDFLREQFAIQPGKRVLDIPYGAGRHAVPLAELGYAVTGLDISAQFLSEAQRFAKERGVSVDWRLGDMRTLAFEREFDAALCFGNSFGYGSERDNLRFLSQVARSLRPGARFVLETYCAEFAARTFQERGWFEAGGITMLEENEYDLAGGGIKTEYTFLSGARTEKKRGWQRMYSFRELVLLLEEAGFGQAEGFRSLDREQLDLKSGRLIVTAEGKPRALLANAITALRYAPEWQEVLAFNEFSLSVATRKPALLSGAGSGPWPGAWFSSPSGTCSEPRVNRTRPEPPCSEVWWVVPGVRWSVRSSDGASGARAGKALPCRASA